MHPKLLLKKSFQKVVESALLKNLNIAKYIPKKSSGKMIVIGAGKAAGIMAAKIEKYLPSDAYGLVVTNYGHFVKTQKINVIEANHPIPDINSVKATNEIIKLVSNLKSKDTVIFLVSGGGSSLLCLPIDGIDLSFKKNVYHELLKSGANISEMNCVRSHLSKVKGGKLAEIIYPAKIITLAISDVPYDDPKIIASGPTIKNENNLEEFFYILRKYNVNLKEKIKQLVINESANKYSKYVAKNKFHLLATPQTGLETASDFFNNIGIKTIILGDSIEGEAREIAKMHASITKQIINYDQPLQKPCVILSGGETSVTVKGKGKGGRNVEFILALALSLNKQKNVWAISCDTDGIDGYGNHAGAYISPSTLLRSNKLGLDSKSMLEDNNAYHFFERLNDLIITGPTLTNINDYRAILIK